MANMYKGNAPCPGCGRTGEDVPRYKKEGLCRDCSEKLRLGESLVKEQDRERYVYKMDDLVIGDMTWYIIPIERIDQALRKLLRTFSMFDKRYAKCEYKHSYQEIYLAGEAGSGTSSDTFVLPRETFDSAKQLCQEIKEACWQLRRDRDNYQKELDAKLNEERNRIYNDGVAHGRNLLFQLNNGEITATDINKEIKKYQ